MREPIQEQSRATNVIHEHVELAIDVTLGFFNIVGAKHQRLAVKYPRSHLADVPQRVSIGNRTTICNHTVIYEGVSIGKDAFVDDYVRIGSGTTIGDGTMLLYGALLYDNIEIGRNCRIAGFLPGRVVVRDNVTMMGTIAHTYGRPLNWFRDEPSPVFEENVVVGLGAAIVGGLTIGSNSYVAANATVTKDVPPHSIVLGVNQIMPVEEFEERKRTRTVRRS